MPQNAPKRPQFRLGFKLSVGVGALLLILAGAVSMLTFMQARRISLAALERQGDAIAGTFNYTFVVLLDGGETFSAQRIASNAAFLPSVRGVLASSLDGKVIAGSGLRAGDPVEPRVQRFLDEGDLSRPRHERDGDELVIFHPLNRAQVPNSLDRGISGVVMVVLDTSEAEAWAQAVALRMLGITLGSGIALSVLTGLILQLIVVRPLYRLASAAERFREGDRSQRSRIRSRDEIGALSEAFDAMAEDVDKMVAELTIAKDKADAASKAKSDFLASMSHELRTPLNGILGFAQILERASDIGASSREGLRIIRRSGEHLLSLINDILDLAKIEARGIDLSPGEVHFSSLVNTVVELCLVRAQQKGIAFTAVTSGPALAGVCVDEKRLTQVLLNLLGNAIKFTSSGSVRFEVHVEEPEPATGAAPVRQVTFRVVDTGPGIAPEDLRRIFDPFVQTGNKEMRSEGTGLGLSISKRIIEQMGGRIEVQSEVGRGSEFTVTLRLEEAPDGLRSKDPSSWTDITGYRGERRTILVVDDRADNRRIIRDLLGPLGFTLCEAERGDDALTLAAERKPDVILMDLAMPGMDGLETTRRLRENPALSSIIVIGSSASVSEDDRRRLEAAGCNDVLPKPVKAGTLLEKLERHLGLEWTKKGMQPAAPSGDGAGAEVAGASLPSEEQIAVLKSLLARGRVNDLLEEVQRLEQAMPECAEWLGKVRELGRGYKLRELRAFLERTS